MVVAKNPGAGRGAGGGRPRRESEVEEVRLRLSPQAAAQLRDLAEARGVPAWRLVEDLVGQAPKGVAEMETPSAFQMHEVKKDTLESEGGRVSNAILPQEVLEIAAEAAAFLAAQEDLSAALAALRRAWDRARAIAVHDLAGPAPASQDEKNVHPSGIASSARKS